MSKAGPAYKDNSLDATPLADQQTTNQTTFTYRLDVF